MMTQAHYQQPTNEQPVRGYDMTCQLYFLPLRTRSKAVCSLIFTRHSQISRLPHQHMSSLRRHSQSDPISGLRAQTSPWPQTNTINKRRTLIPVSPPGERLLCRTY